MARKPARAGDLAQLPSETPRRALLELQCDANLIQVESRPGVDIAARDNDIRRADLQLIPGSVDRLILSPLDRTA